MSNLSFLKTITQFFIWRVALFLLWFPAAILLKYAPSFAGPESLLIYHFPSWIYAWANFDGVHYLTIAQTGYLGTGLIQAFFPFYPLVIRTLTEIQNNFLLNSLIVSNLSFLFVIFLFKKLLNLDKQKSLIAIYLLLLFPTSFFFGAAYNEALFMVFVLASFILSRKKMWFFAGLMVALASATRLVGIFLLPSLLWEFFQTKKFSRIFQFKPLLKAFALSILASSGLGLYMLYLNHDFADPLYFFHLQADFGAGRQESLVLYPQVVWRSVKILLTARPFDLHYLIYIQEFLVGLGSLAILLLGRNKVRLSYLIFALPAFLLPTLTGTFSSLPRYVLVCFPLLIILGEYLNKNKTLKLFWFLFSGLFLILNTMLFLRGYWVS